MEAQGQVKGLELQPSFVLVPGFALEGKKVRELTYSADFSYTNISGEKIIEDVKASEFFKTDVYKVKIKMFKFLYCLKQGVKFFEIFEPGDVQTFY